MGFRNTAIGSCCYQCEDRHLACHDTCEQYQESLKDWKAKQEYLREARKNERIFNDYHINQVARSIKKKEARERR